MITTIVAGMYTGQFVYCGKKAHLSIGNVMPIGHMPEVIVQDCVIVYFYNHVFGTFEHYNIAGNHRLQPGGEDR